MKIYLAGPDVFLPDFGALVFAAKKALCKHDGHEGISPMDGSPPPEGLSPFAQGVAIYRANLAHMRACDAVIANMTPFRGVSMDSGTCFEMGFMAALGKPVLGYTHVTQPLMERTRAYYDRRCHHLIDPYSSGTSIESFAMADNLMMAAAVHTAGFTLEIAAVAAGTELTACDGFRACLKQLANRS